MNLNETIERKFDGLSPGQKQVARWIAKEMKQAAILSAKRIGELAGVSEATVHRLAQALGYERFTAMQSDMQTYFLLDRPVQRLIMASQNSEASWLERHYAIEMANIQETAANKQEANIEQAVQMLLPAERVYFAGWRTGLAVTAPFAYILKYMLGTGVHIPQGEAAEYAAYFQKSDVLFLSGFPRYCERTLMTAQAARDAGTKVIALTDSLMAPFVKLADVSLFASGRSSGFLDSYVGPLAVMNALITRISQSDTERVKLNVMRMEQSFEWFE